MTKPIKTIVILTAKEKASLPRENRQYYENLYCDFFHEAFFGSSNCSDLIEKCSVEEAKSYADKCIADILNIGTWVNK
jgi:hypothetical protein